MAKSKNITKSAGADDALDIRQLPIDKVSVKKGFNPRSELGSLEELKQSLETYGMQSPIIVCPTKDGADTYYVIAGHRRYMAWKELGKTTIPASIRTGISISSPQALALAITENSEDVRHNLSPLDQAKAFKRLMDELGDDANEAQVAKMVGYSVTHVRRMLKLLVVPESVRERLARGEISARAAAAVADVPEAIRERVAERVVAGTSEGEVARIANELKRESSSSKRSTKRADDGEEAAAEAAESARESRHNVPIGQKAGTFATPRGMREVRKMIEVVAADALNAEIDMEEATKKADREAALQRSLARKNQLAALLWQVGTLDEIDIESDAFKEALEEIRQRLEERMDRAERGKGGKDAEETSDDDAESARDGKMKSRGKRSEDDADEEAVDEEGEDAEERVEDVDADDVDDDEEDDEEG